jgi:hypothetical protein
MLRGPTKPSSQRNERNSGDKEQQSFILPSGNEMDEKSHWHRHQQPIK